MGWLNVLLAVYGLFMVVLGIVGSVRGQELFSLSGTVVGLFVLGLLWMVKTKPRLSRILTLLLAVLVAGRFGPKFFKTNVWYPEGIIFAFSALVAVCLIGAHLYATTQKKSASQTGE